MDFFDAQFPGNLSVAERLISAIDGDGIVAFTGAGTSMPEMPSWSSLVESLVQEAKKSGIMNDSVATSLLLDSSDPLYAIDEVYSAAGETQTKVKVAIQFASLKTPTECHRLLMGTNFKKFLTLNYDIGLEMAESEMHRRHASPVTFKTEVEFNAWAAKSAPSAQMSVLHWHGVATDASSIVLSENDYAKFYNDRSDTREILRGLFARERCLLVGFGFSDAFIVSQLGAVMHSLPSENRHFAIIGVKNSSNFNCALERRKFQNKFKSEVIFYNVEDGYENPHVDLQKILLEIKNRKPRRVDQVQEGHVSGSLSPRTSDVSERKADAFSYRSSLFEINGREVYCEPVLWLHGDGADVEIGTSTIAGSGDNYIIYAPHEYGLSTLGKRIASEIRTSGYTVHACNASDVPNYRKKLLQDAIFQRLNVEARPTVIIDNFSIIEHRRMIKELTSTYPNIRTIVLARNSLSDDIVSGELSEIKLERVSLSGLTRSGIRDVVKVLEPTWDSDMCSSAVQRIYEDLLHLCIPLTPSNVIMYASVLCKNGEFTPVSRLHIVERFVSDALQRASDAFSESFGYINKVELFSDFCYNLFDAGRYDFDLSDWNTFCVEYKKRNLVDFGHGDIISDLLNGRIVTKIGVRCVFKYRMFFSYFVGRKIASDSSLLTTCLASNQHLELDGLIDVLCAMVPNCDEILKSTERKLTESLDTFYEKYPIAGTNVHEGRKWEIGASEETLWKLVEERVESGPASTADLDQLKTSVIAERRTIDQKVSLVEFIASEKTVTRAAVVLRSALENARGMSAEVKISSIDAVVRSYALVYEVATIFAPLIAERKYVSWNGFSYINLIENDGEGTPEELKERMVYLVYDALPTSMAGNIADHFGSRKLGAAFLELTRRKDGGPIYNLLTLSLLLRSKPSGWLDRAKEIVGSQKRDDIFLRFALSLAMGQLRNETNIASEVRGLKEFVAAIRLRREANVKSPSKTQINKAVGTLDQNDYFKSSLSGD